MLKFFFTISILFVINFSDTVAQDFNDYYFNNYRNSKNNDDEVVFNSKDSITTKNNYKDNSEDYQYRNAESSPNKYVNPLSSNDYNEKTEFNKSDNNSSNKLNSPTPSKTTKKYANFKDGKGHGYRVYDNSNRQSYFCNLASDRKITFSHDNNFNGIYVGVGLAKIDSAVNFSQTSTDRSFGTQKIIAPYKFDYSGSKSLPSIIIGQGRLFSSGLFLGQEFAMNIGEFNINSSKINNNEYKKITYSFSNYSYYSGKFGFNIFKIFLPYVKLSLSTSSSRFILQKSDDSKVISSGSFPSVGIGAGIDISIRDHVRAIIDYTQFSGSGSGYLSSSKAGASNVVNNIAFDSTYSFTRASLVYRF